MFKVHRKPILPMRKCITPILTIYLALGGCAAYPPDAARVSSLQIRTKQWNAPLPSSERVVALQQWWSACDDDVLLKLLSAAQQASPSVQIARARIDEARAEAKVVGAQLWPRISGNAGYERARSTNEFVQPAVTATNGYANVDASWEIDLWGGVASQRKARLAQEAARQIEWHDARTSLAAEVANAYLSLRALQMRQRLEESSRESLLNSARILRTLHHVGLASDDEAGLLDAGAAESQSRLILAGAEADVLVKVLVELTDIDESVLRNRLGPAAAELPHPRAFAVDAVPADVLSQRPDIRVAVQHVVAAQEEIHVSQARRYPSLSLLGSIGGNRSSNGNSTLSGSSWSFGPTLSVPIFNGGQLKAEVEQSQARYEQAVGEYQRTVRAAVREVEATMVRLDAGRPSEKSLRQAVAKYQSQFDAGQARLSVGSINVIEIEVLRRMLISSQLRLLDQQREQLANWIILYKAVGGQWALNDSSNS